jgi:hypothetical protein
MSSLVDITLRAQRQQTKNLIRTAGRPIALHRPQGLIDDGAGGKKRAAGNDERFPEVQRFFGAVSSLGRGATTKPMEWVTTSLGEKYSAWYVLIGEFDDDIKIGDYFFVGKKKYVVEFLHEDVDQYQTKATVGLIR